MFSPRILSWITSLEAFIKKCIQLRILGLNIVLVHFPLTHFPLAHCGAFVIEVILK